MKTFKVLSQALWVRKEPNSESKRVDIVYKDNILNIDNQVGDWVYFNKGWSKIRDSEGIFLQEIKTPKIRSTRNNNVDAVSGAVINVDPNEKETYIVDTSSSTQYGGVEHSGYFIKNVRGIHGMPYQFMSSVDTRAGEDYTFGRKYSDKIISRLPLLLITPGKPKFMKNFDQGSKDNILQYARTQIKGDFKFEDLLGEGEGKLYSFESCFKDYYSFVNPMCQRMARYLGIHDIKIKGENKPLGSFQWEHYANSAFKNFITSKENVAFYIDSDTQISESFSNSTGESQLVQPMHQLTDMGREIQFLLGAGAGISYDNLGDSMDGFDDWTKKYSHMLPSRLMSNLKQGFKSVVSGGKMIFPEIWNDSSFSRSYRISIKLRTPDADNLSWFMNIGAPMMHLICLVAPHQLGPNGFQSPFLVRGWYKGFFNCDMGIITDMDISKGDKGRWTLNGLPTEVDISFTMKDLYQILSITSDKKMSDLLANTALLDYIANMCGINVSKPDLERAIDLLWMTGTNRLNDIITFDGFLGVENALSNMVSSIFKR